FARRALDPAHVKARAGPVFGDCPGRGRQELKGSGICDDAPDFCATCPGVADKGIRSGASSLAEVRGLEGLDRLWRCCDLGGASQSNEPVRQSASVTTAADSFGWIISFRPPWPTDSRA